MLPQPFCHGCYAPSNLWRLKHGPVSSPFFVWKFMAGPRSPTSPVTAQLISWCWKVISFWCYADCQQRSNQRLVVLPQTRSSSFHGVENNFSSGWYEAFQNHSNFWLGRAPPNMGPVLSRCWTTFFVWMLCSLLKPFKFMAGPRSPTSPVTAQLISRRWRVFRSDVMQIVNNVQINGWSCSPKHDPAHFTVLKHFSRLHGMKLFKNIRFYGWAVLPQTRPSSFHGVDQPFRLDVMHTFKTIQVYGWAALPNIPCHGPAHFVVLKSHFVLMLCRYLTTFKSTAGRAPPNTIQLISRS